MLVLRQVTGTLTRSLFWKGRVSTLITRLFKIHLRFFTLPLIAVMWWETQNKLFCWTRVSTPQLYCSISRTLAAEYRDGLTVCHAKLRELIFVALPIAQRDLERIHTRWRRGSSQWALSAQEISLKIWTPINLKPGSNDTKVDERLRAVRSAVVLCIARWSKTLGCFLPPFYTIYDYAGKAELSQGYIGTVLKTLGRSRTHFSEIN